MSVSRGLHHLSTTTGLEAWQLALPGTGRFTHLTGAQLHGLWLPPLPDDLPVFAAMAKDEPRPRRTGLSITRHVEVGAAVDADGLAVDAVPEVILACARDLELLDVLVLVDSALQLEKCSSDDLADMARQRRRGSRMLRKVLPLADRRSESPYETLLRVLHVVCDAPVEPQFVLKDEHGGFVARADLWLKGTTALHEYDGAHHLPRRRQRKDLARARRIGNETWIRRGYTSAEVLHQGVAILRDVDLSLGRPHDPSRIRAWHTLLVESLFTPSGQQRLRRRLGLVDPPSGHEGRVRERRGALS